MLAAASLSIGMTAKTLGTGVDISFLSGDGGAICSSVVHHHDEQMMNTCRIEGSAELRVAGVWGGARAFFRTPALDGPS